MFKNFITYLSVVLLFFVSACSDRNEPVLDNMIRFDVQNKHTRAAISSAESFADGDAFAVHSVSFYNDDFSNQVIDFNNTPVVFNSSTKKWGYDFKAYWFKDFTYYFMAFFPYADQQSSTRSYTIQNTFNAGAACSYKISNFKVKDVPEEQEDLMVSDMVTRGPIVDVNQASVSFSFHHILSNVKFTLKMKSNAELVKVNLKGVQLAGLKSQGDCNDGVWDSSAYPDDMDGYAIKYPVGGEPALTVADYIPWSNGLLLIPQEVTPNIKLIVDYDLIIKKDLNDNNPTIVPKKEVINLSEYSKKTWDKGTRLNYVMVFDSNMDIEFFIVNVEPWAFAKNSTPVIIQ